VDNYLDKNRLRVTYRMLAKKAAENLNDKAKVISIWHIKDYLIRIRFQEDIQRFIDANMQALNNAKSDNECNLYVDNMRQEQINLEKQDRMLRFGDAVVTASAQFFHDHEKVIGYVIDGIGVVIGGLQVVGGAGILATSVMSGNVVGIIAGANIFLNGLSSTFESYQKLTGDANPTNFMRDTHEDVAEFLGFDRRVGTLSYQITDLSTAYYGIIKLSLKPEAWRLFSHLPSDYYRKVSKMSRPALAIKGAGAAVKAIKLGITINDLNEKEKEKEIK